jgi:hypothetical protein
MTSIWIIGAGKFGLRAARVLRRKNSSADIIMIDRNDNACRQAAGLSFKTVCTDGIAFLAENLVGRAHPDWIVPSIPVHVAFAWLQMKLSEKYCVAQLAVPEDLARSLPNTFKGAGGELYMSNADFICPENCPEPDDICMHTGKPRPRILHKTLASIRYDGFRSIVIRSRQLSPGVGGYPPADLYRALADITAHSMHPVLISTACSCHGVMHALRITVKT